MRCCGASTASAFSLSETWRVRRRVQSLQQVLIEIGLRIRFWTDLGEEDAAARHPGDVHRSLEVVAGVEDAQPRDGNVAGNFDEFLCK